MGSSETRVANGTALSFIPIGHDVPDQTVVGVGLDLFEALLTALAALGPARTLFQTRLRLPGKRREGGLSCRHVNSFRRVRLRAGYDPFAAIQEVSANDRKDAEKNGSAQHGKYCNSEETCRRHRYPPYNTSQSPEAFRALALRAYTV